MVTSLYQYIKWTTVLILLILGGAYWGGVLSFEILLFGVALIREWALIRSFTVVQNDKSVYNII